MALMLLGWSLRSRLDIAVLRKRGAPPPTLRTTARQWWFTAKRSMRYRRSGCTPAPASWNAVAAAGGTRSKFKV